MCALSDDGDEANPQKSLSAKLLIMIKERSGIILEAV